MAQNNHKPHLNWYNNAASRRPRLEMNLRVITLSYQFQRTACIAVLSLGSWERQEKKQTSLLGSCQEYIPKPQKDQPRWFKMYQENECRWQLLEICRTSVRESHNSVGETA